jgi:hypothetical protein
MARTEREKRLFLALVATLAVALMLVMVVSVFGGGSGDSGTPPVAAGQTGATAPKSVPTLKPTPQPSVAPLVFKGVDPFKPLVSTKTNTRQNAPAPAQTAQTPAGPNSAVVGGKTVTLNDIFTKNGTQKVHVDVDGTVYTAAPGDNFYDDYVLVSIADPCAQFAWRDQSFRLCVQPGSGG